MNWQNLAVALVVLLAAAILARRAWKLFSGKKSSCPGCAQGCGRATSEGEAQMVNLEPWPGSPAGKRAK